MTAHIPKQHPGIVNKDALRRVDTNDEALKRRATEGNDIPPRCGPTNGNDESAVPRND
jgi:hypothetical protein